MMDSYSLVVKNRRSENCAHFRRLTFVASLTVFAVLHRIPVLQVMRNCPARSTIAFARATTAWCTPST